MVGEFEGRRCRLCGGGRYAVYTVVRESASAGLLYEAKVAASVGAAREAQTHG